MNRLIAVFASPILTIFLVLTWGAMALWWLHDELKNSTPSGHVQYTERSRCEYSPAGPALVELAGEKRESIGIPAPNGGRVTITATPTTRRHHDPESVKEC